MLRTKPRTMNGHIRHRALLICGSLNQTTQMHSIARELHDFECFFTPFYGDRTLSALRRLGFLESTIMGNKLRKRCLDYLQRHKLPVDLEGKTGNPYDLVITCTDLVVPRNVRKQPLVVLQEGMIDGESLLSRFVQHTRLLPLWVTNTTLTGLSGQYDRFCVASPGYRRLFVKRGAPEDRIVVTGIPNFDNCVSYLDNDVKERGYVLLCTTDMRETFRYENRPALLRRVHKLAAGRPLHIKLHPNENMARACREIRKQCPDAVVHTSGSAEVLVANCDVLVTQYSSVAYVGLALGKEVHSCFDLDELKALLPIQNGGRSAQRVAEVCRALVQEGPASQERAPGRPGSFARPARRADAHCSQAGVAKCVL